MSIRDALSYEWQHIREIQRVLAAKGFPLSVTQLRRGVQAFPDVITDGSDRYRLTHS